MGSARTVRVLVVEDDRELGELFYLVLRGRGHVVGVAWDVTSALGMLATGPWDVVVTDLRLPGGSGFDVLAHARRSTPTARLLLASAFATPEVAARARALGAARVLSKPFEPAELWSAVEGDA